MTVRKRIEISGIVQGVGFRPHVYRLAHRYQLTGQVRNTSAGVTVEVQGDSMAVQQFVCSVEEEAPPLAQITSISVADQNCKIEDGFQIILSEQGQSPDTLIAPDIATCSDCLRELFDTRDRRYGYPFINCTNCGPRFTILRCIPYDRPNTSMAEFRMCAACQAEYDDPLDRRFHAQPNACWSCGPQLRLLDVQRTLVAGDPIELASECLRAGKILAIKGLGGFHLSIDATNASAVERLRLRKKRFEKPFAVMVADLCTANEFCIVSEDDRDLLELRQRPIVLLRPREKRELPESIAPRNPELGLFLPYTPIQHLLFMRGRFRALVMTSANLSEEPICIDNDEAVVRLRGIADFFLVHNRDILLRCDDSVTRTSRGRTAILRRSRGFFPVPIALDRELPPVLAVGGELKNAICITKGKNAFVGQHIGDLENLAAFHFFRESIGHLQNILQVQPEVIAYDLHPGYLSTQWALQQQGIRTVAVQHHHAHVVSCMAENHIFGAVIGVVLDGAGYGTDAQIWGGEILVADFQDLRRAAHLEYVPMPGGAQAIREPWRMAVAHLLHAGHLKESLPFLQQIPPGHLTVVQRMVEQRIRSPLTSSCGRLFDAVAALIGLRTEVTYEGQAAIELEACCEYGEDEGEYAFTLRKGECMEIGTAPLFSEILEDLHKGVARGTISLRFHKGLATVIADAVREIAMDTGIRSVCLTGGCFQNQRLQASLSDRLKCHGLTVFTQSKVPSGDGGLSLGQAVIAAHAIHSDNQYAVTPTDPDVAPE
jgi:[NiFe] hydrogenase maturation protein HypF